MSTDLDLDQRLARVGDHLDGLARRAGADAFDPIDLRRAPARPHRGRQVLLAAAALLVVAAVVGGVIALRGDGSGPVSTADQPGDQVGGSPVPAAADLLAAHPVLRQAVAEVCRPGWVPSAFGVCFLLGPPGFTSANVATARAVDQDGAWGVAITLADDARAEADRMFDACAAASADCPGMAGDSGRGVVAFVAHGRVLAAPAIQAPGLADDALLILPGGRGIGDRGLTRAEAEALAVALA